MWWMVPVACWMGTAEAAKPGDGPEIAVVGMHVPGQTDESSLRLALQVSNAIDDNGGAAVRPKEVHLALQGREALVLEAAALGAGRSKRDEGRILYDRADFEGAIPVLVDAVSAIEKGMAGTGDPRDLISALLLLGQAQWSIGETDAAADAFRRVIVLEPSRQLDPVNYPPKIVRFFNETRDGVLSLEKGSVQLQIPDRNTVLIDGREVLSGTVKLVPGLHYALITGPDGERSYRMVMVQAGEAQSLQVRPKARNLGAVVGFETAAPEGTRQLYGALGTHAGSGLLLLGGVLDNGDAALQLYEVRTGSFSQVASKRAGSGPGEALEDLVPVVLANLTETGTLRTDRVAYDAAALPVSENPMLAGLLLDPEPLVELEAERRRPTWLVWAGVGTVAVGGATVAAVTLAAASGGDDPGDQPEPGGGGDGGVILVGPFPN